MKSKIHSALFGVAVGDALGVPLEFKKREVLKITPVSEMLGYLCWNQPAGTWSDDSSLTFCTAETITENGIDIELLSFKMCKWLKEGYWGAHFEVFDVGGTTKYSLERIINGESPLYSGNFMEHDNGNGSLMRILPLVFELQKENDLDKVYKLVKEVSSITHAHFRSVFACFVYIIYALEMLKGNNKEDAYTKMRVIVNQFLSNKDFNQTEIGLFDRILKNDIHTLKESEIASSGYVLHSLEASIWCVLTSSSYAETVLKAVNLGGDTDTTAAIAGGLAGLIYGYEAIPKDWLEVLARKNDIESLCNRLAEKYNFD